MTRNGGSLYSFFFLSVLPCPGNNVSRLESPSIITMCKREEGISPLVLSDHLSVLLLIDAVIVLLPPSPEEARRWRKERVSIQPSSSAHAISPLLGHIKWELLLPPPHCTRLMNIPIHFPLRDESRGRKQEEAGKRGLLLPLALSRGVRCNGQQQQHYIKEWILVLPSAYFSL